jgi:serine/threonine protein kinase
VKDYKGERMILEKIKHPFVVGLTYAFQTGYTLYLILELANGGDLYNHITRMKQLPEDHWRFYAAEILVGLEYLHQNKIIYRGLKPEDVLLDKDGHIKLSDFGLARSSEDITSTFWGDPYYIAPEIIKGDIQTFSVDWWSFGIIIFEMLSGKTPFLGDSPKGILKAILTKNVSIPDYFTEEAKDLIRKLLKPNPSTRLGSGKKGIAEIKQHKFFKSIDWEKIFNKEYPVPFLPNIRSDSEIWLDDNSVQMTFNEKHMSSSKFLMTSDANISNFYFNVSTELSFS